MFVELMPLLGERTVMITIARLNQNSIRVNIIPLRKKEDENAALTTPLSFSGTPEELDRELASSEKHEDSAPNKIPSSDTTPADQNMTLFATQQK